MTIAEKIKQLRTDRFFDCGTVAYSLGYNPRTVSKWEKGKLRPNIDSIDRICKFYNITLSQFFEGVTIGKADHSAGTP